MKNIFKIKNNSGFSTLFIVIILGSVALTLALALSTSSVWSIKGSVNNRDSNQTKALINACAEVALEQMRENNSYTGSNSVTLDGNTCNYNVSNTGGATRLITVTGEVKDIVRKLEINTLSFNPIVISSWLEVP